MDQTVRWEKRFDLPLLAAALLTIPLIVIEAVHVGRPWDQLARAGDWVVWLIFAAHLVTMVRVSGWSYLWRNPVTTVVVALTFPVLPAGMQSVRAVRLLRVLRIVRFAPILRRFFTLDGVKYAAVLAGVALFGGAAAYAAAEGRDYGTGLYWAIQTLTTVGFGDVSPVTTLGRIVACVLMVVGVGLFAVVTGAIAQQFLAGEVGEAVEEVDASDAAILNEIAQLTAQIQRLEEMVRSRALSD